jgi:threonine synthase
MKNHFVAYHCSVCGADYSPDEVSYTCSKDGGNLDVILDLSAIREQVTPEALLASREPGIWRYLPLLPVADPGASGTPLRLAGGTPVYSLSRLAQQLGVKYLWLKDESRNPSASFKDRASALVMARANELGAPQVVTASTGNAGAALACMAAAAGQQAIIFAPRTAPQAKIAQLLIFGAQVLLVEGTYDDAFDLTIQAAQEFGWYCRNTGYNPFTAEGKKTAAFEIWEWWHHLTGVEAKGMLLHPGDLSHLRAALNIFIPVGDGNIISGIHKGFKDLAALGWIEHIPRLFGVQAEGSAVIARAFAAGSETLIPATAHTLADSISVDLPRDGLRALRAVRQTDGQYLQVSDAEILAAIATLGGQGIFAEPAGAAAYAGLVKALSQGQVKADDPLLVLNTGSGLKDVKAAMQAVKAAPVIEPTLEALRGVIKL